MYSTVSDLVTGLMTYANKRGLTSANPVTITLQDSVTSYQPIRFIVATAEPYTAVMPLDLMWLVTDSSSPNFNKVLRRVNRTPSNGYNQTWVEMTVLSAVWIAQTWDTAIPSDQYARDHVATAGNPHNTTAADVGALDLTGGSMTGALTPRPTPVGDYLSTEVVPRSWIDTALNAVRSLTTTVKTLQTNLNTQFVNLRTRVQVLESEIIGLRVLVYTPTAASDTWNITHTFNKSNVLVEVFDTNNMKVIPASIQIIDAANVQIIFAIPFLGRAEISPKVIF